MLQSVACTSWKVGDDMVKLSIMKRVEAIEQWAKQSIAPPTFVMIHFDVDKRKWSVTEHYKDAGNSKGRCKSKTSTFGRLQEYCFPLGFAGQVLLDTFGCDDPAIHENLFCFGAKEVSAEVGTDSESGFSIQRIKKPEDGSLTAEMEVVVIEQKSERGIKNDTGKY